MLAQTGLLQASTKQEKERLNLTFSYKPDRLMLVLFEAVIFEKLLFKHPHFSRKKTIFLPGWTLVRPSSLLTFLAYVISVCYYIIKPSTRFFGINSFLLNRLQEFSIAAEKIP